MDTEFQVKTKWAWGSYLAFREWRWVFPFGSAAKRGHCWSVILKYESSRLDALWCGRLALNEDMHSLWLGKLTFDDCELTQSLGSLSVSGKQIVVKANKSDKKEGDEGLPDEKSWSHKKALLAGPPSLPNSRSPCDIQLWPNKQKFRHL